MKKFFSVFPIVTCFLICAFISGTCAAVNAETADDTAAIGKQLAGRWMIYDISMPGSPAALEITGDGFVKINLLRIVPPFSDKAYDEWIFKQSGDTAATAKSPGGDEMTLSLEKAGPETFLEVRMGDAYLYLYRPRGGEADTGFTGTWNLPSIPILDFAEDGAVTFPSGNPVGNGDTGTWKILGGNKIAVTTQNKEGADTVFAVLKPSDDFKKLIISINDDDYKAAGENYEKPTGSELKDEILGLVKGPGGDFFYQQPVLETQMKQFRDAQRQAEFMNCAINLTNLQNAQEMHMVDKAEYATSIEQLDPYIGGCIESEDCTGSTLKFVEKSCLPGSFSLSAGESGDKYSYKIMAKSKDDPPCNICITESGRYPESFDGCPNEEHPCGE